MDELKIKLEGLFDVIPDNDITALRSLLKEFPVDTVSDEAGLAGGIMLASGLSLFCYAVQQEQKVEMLKCLLEHGADVNSQDSAGKTAFDTLLELKEMRYRMADFSLTITLLKSAGYTLRPGQSWNMLA